MYYRPNLTSYIYLYQCYVSALNCSLNVANLVELHDMPTSQSVVCYKPTCTGGMRQRLRWADGKLVKEAIDQQLAALLGPRGQDTPQEKTEQVHCIHVLEEQYISIRDPKQ